MMAQVVVPEVVPEVLAPEVLAPLVLPAVVPEVEPEVLPEVEPLVELGVCEVEQALKRVSAEHMMAPVSPKSHLRFIEA